jgi:ornithine carbamoyltransferase
LVTTDVWTSMGYDDENEARKIYHKLTKDQYKVQVSPDGSYGYIFDFVA